MSIVFKLWIHPATGEQRIYLNGVKGQDPDDKVFIFERTPTESDPANWEVYVRHNPCGRKKVRKEAVAQEVYNLFGGTISSCAQVKFAAILEKCKS